MKFYLMNLKISDKSYLELVAQRQNSFNFISSCKLISVKIKIDPQNHVYSKKLNPFVFIPIQQ